ncbi:hypothetical protein ACFSY7_00660 [Kurthia populi]|uniref:Uncharacterized protein n=1 Tax=Kurthia populi TaxID=1562132 RepID=A0ABW5XVQ2_9BACL|nr:hypothetical protein [Kurthia sp. Dielmo]
MYNSPVLFDASPALTTQLVPNAYFKKAAIITDQAQHSAVSALIEKLYDTPHDVHVFKDAEQARAFIVAQKMGTHFYVVANWDEATTIFTTAVEEGVSEAEIQVQLRDDVKKYIYCMKCFTSSEILKEAVNVQCACGAHLEVGPFYSKVRQGYIGYPFIPEA